MTAAVLTSRVAQVLERYEAAVSELVELASPEFGTELAGELARCSDEQIVEVWRRFETARRREPVFEHALVGQVEARQVPFRHGCKTVAQFATNLLRISPAEAAGRVRAAERLGWRSNPQTGQRLAPIYPGLAAAQAAGEISAAHAQVITSTIEKLPDEITWTRDAELEELLLGQARALDPAYLARAAERLRATLDPDGRLRDDQVQQRRRRLDLHRRPDGSAHLEAELTAECAEHFETHLDALAKPAPAADGTKDPRTAGQRRHDALLAMLQLVERADLLPKTAGVSATILLHLDADTYGTGHGTATTGHGYAIPADLAKNWAGPEARIIAVLLSKTKRVEAYSSTHRIFTEQQRLAMMARDLGCSFPTCDSGPLWTEAHHVTEFQAGGATSTDNGALVCEHDHAGFTAMGWTCTIINGAPWWVPPEWIDPAQRPIRNIRHEN